jgi:hypothetical protein
MGCDLENLKEWAQEFKEKVWYYIDCNEHKMVTKPYKLKQEVNDLLDFIDSLEA